MNEALDLILALHTHRHHVAAVAHRHDILLQRLGIGAAGDIVLQGLFDLVVGLSDLAADVTEGGACLVGDHILGNDGAIDAILQTAVGQQALKDLVQHRIKMAIDVDVIQQASCGAQDIAHVQQIAGGKGRPLPCALHRVGDVCNRAEGWHSLIGKQATGIARALQILLYDIFVVIRQKRQCTRGSTRCGRQRGKHLQDLAVFQFVSGFDICLH